MSRLDKAVFAARSLLRKASPLTLAALSDLLSKTDVRVRLCVLEFLFDNPQFVECSTQELDAVIVTIIGRFLDQRIPGFDSEVIADAVVLVKSLFLVRWQESHGQKRTNPALATVNLIVETLQNTCQTADPNTLEIILVVGLEEIFQATGARDLFDDWRKKSRLRPIYDEACFLSGIGAASSERLAVRPYKRSNRGRL